MDSFAENVVVAVEVLAIVGLPHSPNCSLLYLHFNDMNGLNIFFFFS